MANLIGSNIHVLANAEMAKHNPSSSASHWAAQTQIASLLKIQIDKDKQKVKSEEQKIPDVEESAKVNGEHLDDKRDYKPSEHMNDKQEYEYDDKDHLVHINIVV
jgi:hypothetical protein